MTENSGSVLKVLSDIQSLRSFLRSEVSIDNSKEEETLVTVDVTNVAPNSKDGGNVVFLGVGLRVIDSGSHTRGGNDWPSKISKTRPSDQEVLRQQYTGGMWSGGNEAFPLVTSDEKSHGEVLFHGESVRYEVAISKDELPFLEIRIEGTVSRRHLLRCSWLVEELELLRKPLVAKAFQSVDTVDVVPPLVGIANELPSVGPHTTFADIEKIKILVEKGRSHLNKVVSDLKKIGNSETPSRELQDYVTQIMSYIKSSGMAFDATQKVLSGGDMEKIKLAVDEMKRKLLEIDGLKSKRAQTIGRFDIKA